MKEIALNRGKVTLVDDEDYAMLTSFKWNAQMFDNVHWYVYRYTKSQCILMHRVILDAPKGLYVDHINGEGLDNRRSNLRIVTPSQNQMNRTMAGNNTSGFKGVTKIPRCKSWMAQIGINGRTIYLGSFASREEASAAYQKAAERLHGDFRR